MRLHQSFSMFKVGINNSKESPNLHLKLWCLALLCLFPMPAFALPTPDALISVANILPMLMGAIVTVLGGAYFAIRRILGPQADGIVIGGVFGSLIVLLGVLVFVAYQWNSGKQQARINDIAMYLRCDISAHESYLAWNKGNRDAKKTWKALANFSTIRLHDVAVHLETQPDATFIATPKRSIQYHSGIPGVKVNGEVQLFTFVRQKALPAYLEQVFTKDLYLADFYGNYKRNPDKYLQDLAKFDVFKKFEHIYITLGSGDADRYVVEDNGSIRAADGTTKIIEWPVREENWVIDDARVQFPHMLDLLPDADAVDYIEDEDVYLVAPFNSFHRHSYIQIETYLDRLLYGIDPKRVLVMDMNDAKTEATMERLAKVLDGKPFMVVGLTKYDWIYDGLDVAFEMWERLGHDPDRFQLHGFTTRLPEVSAIRWEAQNTKGVVDYLWQPFWGSVVWLVTTLNMSVGMAIILFAIGLRLVFSPLGILEARSRFMRSQVKLAKQNVNRPTWAGSSQVLTQHLKVSSLWEFVGTFLMLALILPAYTLLTTPPVGVYEQGFLWLKHLSEPDLLLSFIVSGLIYFKVVLSGTGLKQATLLLLTACFAALLWYLPSSLLLYVFGVLLVTTLQEVLALRHSKKQIKHALLLS